MPGIESEQELTPEYQTLPERLKKAVSALTMMEEGNRALRVHFGYSKTRKRPNSPEMLPKESTVAECKRLFDACCAVQAMPGRILSEIREYYEKQTGEEDPDTFAKSMRLAEHLGLVKFQDDPADRRIKRLTLLPAGELGIEAVAFAMSQTSAKMMMRGDFAHIETDPEQHENMIADYNQIAVTDDDAIRLVQGKPQAPRLTNFRTTGKIE